MHNLFHLQVRGLFSFSCPRIKYNKSKFYEGNRNLVEPIMWKNLQQNKKKYILVF